MRLNADIIYAHLRKSFEVEFHGTSQHSLHLGRPTFYMPSQTEFLSDHLYLASADHLPAQPVIRRGVVLVCVGDAMVLRRYLNRCTVLQIKGSPDFLSVYLKIQEIYDLYDAWNDDLFELFKTELDIKKIVVRSTEVLERPLLVIDSDFHVIASSRQDDSMTPWKDEEQNLSAYSIDHYLSSNKLHIDKHGAIFLKIVDTNALCVNLFDTWDNYMGCLCVLIAEEEAEPGLDALAEYLAHLIEAALLKNPSILATEHNARKGVLRDLVNGQPLGHEQRWLLNSPATDSSYLCVTLHSFGSEKTLPATFVCGSFEMAFPGSYAFPIDQMIVAVIDCTRFSHADDAPDEALGKKLRPLLESLKLSAGVSGLYRVLYETPTYVRQAESAIIDGSLLHPQESLHHFRDYALTEMVISALAGSPIDSLYPHGFRRVIEHDEASSISYVETLRVLLAESMNYSKAAAKLFVHRSTLIDRVERMERDFGLDLHDPDSRLHLQIILKALQVEHDIQSHT